MRVKSVVCAILREPRPPGEDGGYEKKGCTIDLSFWRAPERLFDEPDELVTWAPVALAAARRVAAKRERTSPRRKSKPQPTTWRA
jgi:TfoX/Sxy family transcriptional regulator of competence genes